MRALATAAPLQRGLRVHCCWMLLPGQAAGWSTGWPANGSTEPPPDPRRPGFTAVDVLALGALGHVLGVGIVLGLKATGNL